MMIASNPHPTMPVALWGYDLFSGSIRPFYNATALQGASRATSMQFCRFLERARIEDVVFMPSAG
jgi:hypothetical protein